MLPVMLPPTEIFPIPPRSHWGTSTNLVEQPCHFEGELPIFWYEEMLEEQSILPAWIGLGRWPLFSMEHVPGTLQVLWWTVFRGHGTS